MFGRLRTKLTVLYAALFGATLVLISLAVSTAVTRNLRHMVHGELAANGAVFNRVWSLRTRRLHDEADVLAHDFGFRAAVATGDDATMRSALENLRARVGVSAAFVVGLDGKVVAAGVAPGALPAEVASAVGGDPDASGAFSIAGVPYNGAAAPVMAPALVGTVVFASRMDQDMGGLEKLSSIPLHARVVMRAPGRGRPGTWTIVGADRSVDARSASALVARAIADPRAPLSNLRTTDGAAAAAVDPLKMLGPGEPMALLIYYPMRAALAPLAALLGTIAAVGASGLVLVVLGSWGLAATLTRPLSVLDDAAKRLQRGEHTPVVVKTRDEIGRLAGSFNAMAAGIRERETNLERARALAESASRAKSSFLTNMSHEVRTPLNGVVGVAGVLAGTRLDEGQRRMVSVIEQSAGALQRVLGDVLELARIEAGHLDIASAPFDLGALLDRLAATTRAQAQTKGLRFERRPAAGAPGWANGDQARLEQILAALLGNAVKFTDAGGVVFQAERTGDACRFVVRDTGVGFDPARTEELFQAFIQADASSTRAFGGAGLGLSIARALARSLGGDVVGEGRPGGGATFTVDLPLPACAAAKAPASAAKAPERKSVDPVLPNPVLPNPVLLGPAPSLIAEPLVLHAAPADGPAAEAGPAIRILLADDHPTNRTVVQLILDSVGVELVAVENGAEAVAAFRTQRFDAVLMDLQMPVMDGLTAIRLIRQHEQATSATPTPVLVLSANAMPEHIQGSAAAGADAHLVKPVVAPVLLEALAKAIDGAEPAAEPAPIQLSA